MMKKVCFLLLICVCVGLCACAGSKEPIVTTKVAKSAEAQKADAFILAIGEVTADSEAAILAAQAYYDKLTEAQKAEVEHYDVLAHALEVLPQKKQEAQQQAIQELRNKAAALMEKGDYIQASSIVYEHPELDDYDALVKQCGAGVMPQIITQNGTKQEKGYYWLKLVDTDGTEISALYYPESNKLCFSYYFTGYGAVDGVSVNYFIGDDEMTFERATVNQNIPTNSQKGTISVSEYTGTYSGSIVENVDEPLILHGLTVTSFKTVYDTQTKGYRVATISRINEMLDAMYDELVQAGYKGTMCDIGFPVYVGEQ